MPASHHSSARPPRPDPASPVGRGAALGEAPQALLGEPTSAPSAWLQRWLGGLPAGARVIDLAGGSGRNQPLLIAQGLQVVAVDRDRSAVDALAAPVRGQVMDLEDQPWELPAASFDAVIVCNYLFRPRLALVLGLLAPGGLLLYETFAVGNQQFGRPSNPQFLLRPAELFDAARRAGLHVLAYEDGIVELPKPARVQRICALRPPFDAARFRLDAPVG